MNTISRLSAVFVFSVLPVVAFAGGLDPVDEKAGSIHLEGNSLLAVSGKAKSADMISLDIMSDGTAMGFQFSIPVQSSSRSSVKGMDLSKCLSDLPKTHTGGCAYRPEKNDVVVIVYSLENTLLPAGVVGIGSIRVPGVLAKSLDTIKPTFVSPSGKQL